MTTQLLAIDTGGLRITGKAREQLFELEHAPGGAAEVQVDAVIGDEGGLGQRLTGGDDGHGIGP
jgi:hypothetical protein